MPSGTYKFVFLDACNTAVNDKWVNKFNISDSSNNKAFLGWTASVAENNCLGFCNDFWGYISSTNTVYEAMLDAADNGSGRPIRFVGDTDWNGYY